MKINTVEDSERPARCPTCGQAIATYSTSDSATSSQIKTKNPSQPPPIPPKWTRPNIDITCANSSTPSPDKRSASVPSSDRKECIAAVVSDTEVHLANPDPDTPLTGSFARLALRTSAAGASLNPSAPQVTAARSTSLSPSKSPSKKAKFYSVTIGRRTGVFNNWPYVESLVSCVPGNKQISFKTEAEAYEHYYSKKSKGEVRVIWVSSSDDDIFGPEAEAME